MAWVTIFIIFAMICAIVSLWKNKKSNGTRTPGIIKGRCLPPKNKRPGFT